ncbi:hypothetical protein, partial [Rhodopirellula bahusiensis]|uniref:hypothetical protein n=1 Tax=Rhodopirellula bahusiensis TaxID=2014065 RepID=UPI00329852B6
ARNEHAEKLQLLELNTDPASNSVSELTFGCHWFEVSNAASYSIRGKSFDSWSSPKEPPRTKFAPQECDCQPPSRATGAIGIAMDARRRCHIGYP